MYHPMHFAGKKNRKIKYGAPPANNDEDILLEFDAELLVRNRLSYIYFLSNEPNPV